MTEQINREFYEAILNFEKNEASRQYYYETLYSKTGRILPDGNEEIVKNVILRVYGILFCEDLDLAPGAEAPVLNFLTDEQVENAQWFPMHDEGENHRHTWGIVADPGSNFIAYFVQ